MVASGFTLQRSCPACGLPFERASGEVSGGMGINVVVAELIAVGARFVFGIFTIIFPIAFTAPRGGLTEG